ncbi:sulfotransferase domain-containing protein [Hoyosella sp. YIM 151337]|uniref:sulfotransferase domain-containing protein n=1 Tax=Hoyosella sp. YIM 151337 TaxID=2992742 RepID=UPI0022356B3F|nr:sulfotransferase domain-containing protein [Hoyosella sp. YIM 151337]MCW4351910.1 sulfotransferase domain-containing protein [Hoyosella sp. YIM 151337]
MTTNLDDERLVECYRIVEEELKIRYRGEYKPRDIARLAENAVRAQFLPHYFSYVPGWRRLIRSFKKDRVLPDFACVGAIKSGTSELATYLMQHPNMLVPLSKEPNRPDAEKWRVFYPTAEEKSEIESKIGKTLAGYFEPRLHQVTVLDTFHDARPDAKAIIVLRDPVRRMYSHFKWDILMAGQNKLLQRYTKSYLEYVTLALEVYPAHGFPTAITGMPPLQAGIYAPSVKLWLERFGRSNIHFVFAEDFFADINCTVNDIYEFLGLSPFRPVIRETVNQNPIATPHENPEAKALLQEFYQPHNEELFGIIGRSGNWT